MTSNIPTLQIMSMANLYRRFRLDSLKMLRGGRPFFWDVSESVAYMNDAFRLMIFDKMIFCESREDVYNLEVVDGWQRVSTIAMTYDIWFDLEKQEFCESNCGNACVSVRFMAENGPAKTQDKITRSGLHKETFDRYAASILYFFERWESQSIPVYRIYEDCDHKFTIFDELNLSSEALTPADLNRVNRARTCRCTAKPWESISYLNTCTTQNSLVLDCRIGRTEHSHFFGLSDVICAIHTVAPETVQNLCLSKERMEQNITQLKLLARQCAEQLAEKMEYPDRGKEIIGRIENNIRSVDEAWGRYRSTDCITFEHIDELENALSTLSGWASECPDKVGNYRRIPKLPLRFDGCFLSREKKVCGETFLPGVYLSNNPRGTNTTELLYHELTHAYLHVHKNMDIDCPWIEEGLAELCGRLWRNAASGGTPSLDPVVYKTFKPENLLYYNFLGEVIRMTPEEIVELFRNYTFTSPNQKPDLTWVDSIIQPYCL